MAYFVHADALCSEALGALALLFPETGSAEAFSGPLDTVKPGILLATGRVTV